MHGHFTPYADHRADFIFIIITVIHHLLNVDEPARVVHFSTFCRMEKFLMELRHAINTKGVTVIIFSYIMTRYAVWSSTEKTST